MAVNSTEIASNSLRRPCYNSVVKKIFRPALQTKLESHRVTTVHHLHRNKAGGSPVDNMRRCLLSPYLYPLLGLCRCYFLEQCPSEQRRDVTTPKPTSFSIICLTQSADLEAIYGTERATERIYCIGGICSICCTSGISMMKGRF